MTKTAGIKNLNGQFAAWALPLLLAMLIGLHAFGQAPIIGYSSPKVYQLNTPIAPLLPTNTGGAVPATVYGTVSTLAGSTRGYADGTGSAAKFSNPGGIAIDLNDNIYVADRGNNVVRKITPAGVVSTFAGTFNTGGATDAAGAAARFDGLSGITFDGTYLYVAESQNGKIRKIDLNGNVSTYTGKPNMASAFGNTNGDPQNATFQYPWGMVTSSTGDMYIADYSNNQIRKYAAGGQVSTFAGSGAAGFADGTGTAAMFKSPVSVAIGLYNNIYVTDYSNNRVRIISQTGDVITFAGNGSGNDVDGSGTSASIRLPYYITSDATGNLYISTQGSLIRRINPGAIVTTVAGTGATGSANGAPKQASFNGPAGLALDHSGNLFAADEGGSQIRKITVTGYTIDKPLPSGLNFDVTTGVITGTPTVKQAATIYVVTAFNAGGSSSALITIKIDDVVTPPTNTVQPPAITYQSPQVYYPGYKITDLKPANTGGAVPAIAYGKTTTINIPGYTVARGVAADANGNVYFTDYNKYQIIKAAADGTLSVFAGDANAAPETKDGVGTAAHFYFPLFLAADAVGNIYETESNLVRKINIATGQVTTITGTATAAFINGSLANARFNGLQGIDVDAAGTTIYVADKLNNVVRKIDLTSGQVSTLNTSTLTSPIGVAYDAVTGNVYVSEQAGLIKKITSAGAVSIVAGSAANGRADGTGTAASFSANLGALTVDQLGNLYVSDADNNLIRKITAAGVVSTLAGSTQGKNDGIGTGAQFYNPYGTASDKNGFVYITDNNNVLIRKISTYGYTIDKPLPAGLTFDTSTGIISGIPNAVTPAANYTVTAYNGGGFSSYTINIQVAPVPQPAQVNSPVISYNTPNTYYVNTTIADLAPVNTGGAVPPTLYSDVSTVFDAGNNSASTFNTPVSVAVDYSNNIYVADNGASQVKKIVRNTTVTPNTYTITPFSATFNHPTAVATDALGNVYVADENGNEIRKFDVAGNNVIYAGGATAGFFDGPAASAKFNQISGMVTDAAGNLYVADKGNSKIREVTASGSVITLAVGFNQITNLVSDGAGKIYFTEYGANKIRILDLTDPINPKLTDYAGSGSTGNADGQRAVASFNGPYGLALDPTGNLYISDEKNYTVRRADINDKTVVVMAGNNIQGYQDGVYIKALFNKPGTMVFDYLGNLILTDGDKIRNIVATGYTINGKNGEGLPPPLAFDPKTGIISGTPGVVWSPTDYVITAYNAGGSSVPSLVNIEVVLAGFNFSLLPAKTVCDIGTSFSAGASTNRGTITYTSSDPTVATIDAGGTIRILKKGTTNITATNNGTNIMRTLTVSQPNITVSITQTNSNTCENTKTDFTAGYALDVPNVIATYTYAWKVNGVAVNVTTPDFSSTTLKNGDKVTCTISACFGTGTKDVFPVLMPVRSFSPRIQSSVSGAVCPGTPITYMVLPLSNVQQTGYQWQVNGRNVGANNPSYTTNTLQNGDRVTCLVTSTSACLTSTTLTSNEIVTAILSDGECVIKIPNAFTPNGDGYNDNWQFKLPAAVNFKVSSVKIYSRSGALVFQSVGYDKPWDGTMNGQRLPVSTYYYIVESEDGKRVTGNVTIIR